MKLPAILTLILSLFISGCNGLQKQEQTTGTDTVEPAGTMEPSGTMETTNNMEQNDIESHEWQDLIQLDEGKPWRLNRETTAGMGRISERIENSRPETVEEYRELGNELQRERENLDSSRTPDNASDDNLNLYLEPLDEKIRQLQEVQSVEEGDQLKSELEQHLHAYSDYFV